MALKKKSETNKEEAPEIEEAAQAETTEAAPPARKKAAPAPVRTTAPVTAGVFIQNEGLVALAADAKYGDFAPIVATGGTHSLRVSEKVPLGEVIEFQAIHAKPVWKVSPGDNDDESRDYFKVSYDGEVCEDGTPVEEALQDALEAGYAKAKISEGIDVVILLKGCDKNKDRVGKLYTLQLSPSSARNWRPLAKNVAAQSLLGSIKTVPVVEGQPDEAALFRSIATLSTGDYDYTFFDFELV